MLPMKPHTLNTLHPQLSLAFSDCQKANPNFGRLAMTSPSCQGLGGRLRRPSMESRWCLGQYLVLHGA